MRLGLEAEAARAAGFDTIVLDGRGQASLLRDGRPLVSAPIQCAIKSELSTPDGFLLELLQR